MSDNIQGLTLSSNSPRKAEATSSVGTALLPIMAAVFVAFLVTGLALPVLPLHVREGPGLGTFVGARRRRAIHGVTALALVLTCSAAVAVRLPNVPRSERARGVEISTS